MTAGALDSGLASTARKRVGKKMEVLRANVHRKMRPEEIETLETPCGIALGQGGYEFSQRRVEFGMIGASRVVSLIGRLSFEKRTPQ